MLRLLGVPLRCISWWRLCYWSCTNLVLTSSQRCLLSTAWFSACTLRASRITFRNVAEGEYYIRVKVKLINAKKMRVWEDKPLFSLIVNYINYQDVAMWGSQAQHTSGWLSGLWHVFNLLAVFLPLHRDTSSLTRVPSSMANADLMWVQKTPKLYNHLPNTDESDCL